MRTKTTPASANGAAVPGGPQTTLPISETPPRRQRRPALAGIGVAVAALGALGGVMLVDQAGNRETVLAVAHDVAAGETIGADDLTVAHIAPDPALDPVPASRKASVVGKTAAADLPTGTLLTDASFRAGRPLAQGKDVVGILAKPGQLPGAPLKPGDEVTIVHTPEEEATPGRATTPDSIPATVTRVGEPDANGAQVVDVAASSTDSTALASWTASGNVAIVMKAKN